jgi:hypothetical protein
MIEISIFGVLFGTLTSALSVVLVIVALTSVTYVAMTLITALRTRAFAPEIAGGALRRARLIGVSAAVHSAGVALFGLLVGSAGSGGELIPTLSVIIAGAAALGSMTAGARLFGARVGLSLKEARAARALGRSAAAQAETRLLEAENKRRHEGADLQDEAAEAEAALARLRSALQKLAATRDEIAAALDQGGGALASDLSAEYRRAQDEVKMKLEIGERILAAAEAATFRLACNAPLRRLVRRRPKEALLGIERLDTEKGSSLPEQASLEPAVIALSSFLGEIREARGALDALERKRPADIKPHSEEDAWYLAQQDLDALEDAYAAVLSRVEVVRVRRAAEATMEEVADAAGALSATAKGLSADQAEISELATEVTRAETAVVMATPVESDPGAITLALSRCTAALDRSDGASLDELLKALRSIV